MCAHLYYPWWWSNSAMYYYRECSLLGCSFSETTKTLIPTGQTEIVGEASAHEHTWTPWQSTADQLGLYTPPWQYKRACIMCTAEEKAENLVIYTE